MKILWHSVKPTIPSGYGTQTALWTRALKAAGHDVLISCSCGLFSSVEVWNGIKLYPHSNHIGNYGTDIIAEHAKNLEPDIVWSWLDAFVLRPTEIKKVKWAAWVPVDSDPLMVRNILPLKECKWVIAPTRFALKVLRQAGINYPLYLPCAYDPSEMYQRTCGVAEAKRALSNVLKKDLNGKYLVNVVSANSGERKNFPAIFAVWKKFHALRPDSILYLHTEITGVWGEGENLAEMMKLYDVPDESVVVVNQWHYNTGQIGNDYLNLVYNASNVHLNTCVGEGFGLPIMDAQACGCPTIVPDFAAAGEIGFGLKVGKGVMRPLVPGGFQFMVDVDDVVAKLEGAYCRQDDIKWREEMALRAADYQLDNVMRRHMEPILERIKGELK